MRKNKKTLIFIFSLFCCFALRAETVKKVIKYKQKTSVDLSGTIVQGKAKTPEVFYIFRRKRTAGGELLPYPATLNHHHDLTKISLFPVKRNNE